MKPSLILSFGVFVSFALSPIARGEMSPESAVARVDKVNVRAQPSKQGEILGSLHKGQRVTVLGKASHGGPGDAALWTKIALPENINVWVHQPSLDSKTGTVKAKKAVLRAGPGVNYSEIGSADQGAPVNILRQVDDWDQIAAPPGTYAFVASDLIESAPPNAAAVPSETAARSPGSIIATPLSGSDARHAATPPITQEAAIPLETDPRVATETHVESTARSISGVATNETVKVAIDAAPPRETPVASEVGAETSSAASGATKVVTTTTTVITSNPSFENVGLVSQPPIIYKDQVRQVYRHGVVRRSLNPKTPTLYELRSLRKGEGLMDYLYSDDPALRLGQYSGHHVIVTGEEYVDPNYDQAPVIKVKEIKDN